jgi:hypothetical protein
VAQIKNIVKSSKKEKSRLQAAGKHDFLRDACSVLLQYAREKERGGWNKRRAKEAALSVGTTPVLLRHPYYRSARFTF